jgi:hypothetical protein
MYVVSYCVYTVFSANRCVCVRDCVKNDRFEHFQFTAEFLAILAEKSMSPR